MDDSLIEILEKITGKKIEDDDVLSFLRQDSPLGDIDEVTKEIGIGYSEEAKNLFHRILETQALSKAERVTLITAIICSTITGILPILEKDFPDTAVKFIKNEILNTLGEI